MGRLIEQLKGSRIYLDANIWIYALENVTEYSKAMSELFEATKNRSIAIVTSELTLAETLVRSIKEGDTAKQAAYTAAITATNNVTATPINRTILLAAAKIRGQTKLKLPDAIHAATAIATDCTTFLTNDQQFRTVSGLHTVLLSQATEEFINDDDN